jgi:hypothetical protein
VEGAGCQDGWEEDGAAVVPTHIRREDGAARDGRPYRVFIDCRRVQGVYSLPAPIELAAARTTGRECRR